MSKDRNSASKKHRKDEASWPLILASAIFLLGVYLVFNAITKGTAQVEEIADPRQAELEREQRVEYYKRQLGERINRSRTLAEHQMTKEARQAPPRYQQESGYRQSVEGLPLDYEAVSYAPREQSQQVQYDLPDHKIAYDLRDEQNADFWVEEAQRKFLREYLLNARAQGYDLVIDSNYNVIVRSGPKKVAQARMPQNALEPLVLLRFKPPFFLPPPFCY